MMSIPDSFFKASTGREMINGVLKQIDVQERQKSKEFRDNGMSYVKLLDVQKSTDLIIPLRPYPRCKKGFSTRSI